MDTQRLGCRIGIWVWGLLQPVMSRTSRPLAGQSATEAALIMAVICLIAIPAFNLLREAFSAMYLAHQVAVGGPVATPTSTP